MKRIGQILLFLLLIYWSVKLFSSKTPWIIIDHANLLFHEAGHFLFMFFGEFMSFLGGTLLQVLIPSSIFVYFYLKQEHFSSLVVLFWLGDNFINIGNYMKDAKAMSLPLLIDGSIHDWNWIFTQLNMLNISAAIGTLVYFIGVACILISLFMILFIIIRSFTPKSF